MVSLHPLTRTVGPFRYDTTEPERRPLPVTAQEKEGPLLDVREGVGPPVVVVTHQDHRSPRQGREEGPVP